MRASLYTLMVAVCLQVPGTTLSDEVAADPLPAAKRRTPAVFRSNHFVVHTDLSPSKADELIARLERTLANAVDYWGRKPRRRIQCYVVDDLQNWSGSALPHRLARVFVGGVSGATIVKSSKVRPAQPLGATVYASTAPGVAEHEIVHAYCSQNYGTNGPYWYKEGMAEMAVICYDEGEGVRCSAEQIEQLRIGPKMTLAEVVSMGRSEKKMTGALVAMLTDPKNRSRQVPLSDWTADNTRDFHLIRDHNLRCWLLCYMLHHNPNYSERFRSLGMAYLSDRDAFETLFGALREELSFEYTFLLDRIDIGYRVDLCKWDWRARFASLNDSPSREVTIQAARGYQASGVLVQAGQSYRYRADGEWATSASRNEVDADGDLVGRGVLIGAIMNGFELTEPMVLGAGGTFTAAVDGKLFLRCRDAWNEIQDNLGAIRVSVRHEYR